MGGCVKDDFTSKIASYNLITICSTWIIQCAYDSSLDENVLFYVLHSFGGYIPLVSFLTDLAKLYRLSTIIAVDIIASCCCIMYAQHILHFSNYQNEYKEKYKVKY